MNSHESPKQISVSAIVNPKANRSEFYNSELSLAADVLTLAFQTEGMRPLLRIYLEKVCLAESGFEVFLFRQKITEILFMLGTDYSPLLYHHRIITGSNQERLAKRIRTGKKRTVEYPKSSMEHRKRIPRQRPPQEPV